MQKITVLVPTKERKNSKTNVILYSHPIVIDRIFKMILSVYQYYSFESFEKRTYYISIIIAILLKVIQEFKPF